MRLRMVYGMVVPCYPRNQTMQRYALKQRVPSCLYAISNVMCTCIGLLMHEHLRLPPSALVCIIQHSPPIKRWLRRPHCSLQACLCNIIANIRRGARRYGLDGMRRCMGARGNCCFSQHYVRLTSKLMQCITQKSL